MYKFYYSRAPAQLAHASAPHTQGFSEGKGACVHVFYYSRALAHLARASAPRTQRFLREQTFARTRAFDAAPHARGLRLYTAVQLELEYAGSTR